MADTKEKQILITERLQLKLLEHFEKLLDGGVEMTSTDAATISRLLMANGWSIDPSKLPQGVRDKLTLHVDPKELDAEQDADIRYSA